MFLVLLLLTTSPVVAQLPPAPAFPESTATLELPPPGVGDEYVDVVLSIPEGWHSYWRNPGDTGGPPSFSWTLPQGITLGEPQWPLPTPYRSAGITTFAVDGTVRIRFPVKRTPGAEGNLEAVRGSVEWLYCREVCIPAFAEDLTPVRAPREMYAPTATRPAAAHFRPTESEIILEVSLPGDVEPGAERWYFFPDEWGPIDQSAEQVWTQVSRTFVRGRLTPGPLALAEFSGVLVGYQRDEPVVGIPVTLGRKQ